MSKTDLWARLLGRCLILALTLSLLAGAALGETGRGDLAERFAGFPQMEYGGETWYLRSRLTVLMATGILADGDGAPRTDFVAVIAIDDNEKRITPIYIDGRTIVEAEGERMPLREVYALGEDPDENCLRVAAAVNGLLGGELLEDYMAVDLEGITAVAAFSHLAGDTRERLHLLRLILENVPARQLNEMYGEISDYVVTDMKSGAVMRVLDKTDRYEIAETVDLPVLPERDEDAPLLPDAERIPELVLDVFYQSELF